MWIAIESEESFGWSGIGPKTVGVFTDYSMAKFWRDAEKGRDLIEMPCLDKTFSQMAVESNTKYEG